MNGGEVEFLRPHLSEVGVPNATVDELVRRWSETGTASFIQHLGESGVLPAAESKQLAMVFKGYLSLEVSTLLGALDVSQLAPASDSERLDEHEAIEPPPPRFSSENVVNSCVHNAATAADDDEEEDGALSFFGGASRESSSTQSHSHRSAESLRVSLEESETSGNESEAATGPAPSSPEPEPSSLSATESMSLSAFVHTQGDAPPRQSHLLPSPAAPIPPPPGVHVVPDVPAPVLAPEPALPTPGLQNAVNPLAGAFSVAGTTSPAEPAPVSASSARSSLESGPPSSPDLPFAPVPKPQSSSFPATASASFPPQQTAEGPVRVEVGATLGRYTLQEMLGEGSTSRIFRAFHETLGVPVAIKVYRPTSRVSSAELEEKFVNEARMLARLDHSNIVRVLDVDVANHLPFIVFEYVGAMTLEELTDAIGKLPADRVAKVGIQVADALAYAAEHSLLHRDVKPANVLLKKDGTAKLADFGLATVGGAEGDTAICGSPAYMAPEQILDPLGVDQRSDMYGLGAMLYHAAVGQPPFVRSSPKETLRAQIHELPTPVHQLDPSFDEALSNLIMRLLEKKPDNRFLNWSEVCAALRTCMSIVAEGSTRHHPQRDSSGSSTSRLKRVMSSILGAKAETS